MIYYPEHLKYVEVGREENEALLPRRLTKPPPRSAEWRLSIYSAWIAGFHLLFPFLMKRFTTNNGFLSQCFLCINHNLPPCDCSFHSRWFCSISNLRLGHTFRRQRRPSCCHPICATAAAHLSDEACWCLEHPDDDDSNSWGNSHGDEHRPAARHELDEYVFLHIPLLLTSYNASSGWITFAVAALLQGCLLLMCIAWKMRQQKLNVDDFGNPLGPQYPPPSWSTSDSDYHVTHENTLVEDDEPVPGLVTEPSENPIAVRVALATALESAVETDLLTPGTVPSNRHGHTN